MAIQWLGYTYLHNLTHMARGSSSQTIMNCSTTWAYSINNHLLSPSLSLNWQTTSTPKLYLVLFEITMKLFSGWVIFTHMFHISFPHFLWINLLLNRYVCVFRALALHGVWAVYQEDDDSLIQKWANVIHLVAILLEKCQLVKYKWSTGCFTSTDLGRIAFYLATTMLLIIQWWFITNIWGLWC